MFRIRTAEPSDTAVILELIHGLAEYEKAGPGDISVTEDDLRDSLFGERPSAEVLLACEGVQAVGFAVFFHNFSTWLGRRGLYLEDLFVKPEFRGRGYGKALLGELGRIARERNCGRFEWMVLDWNTPAIGFYKRMGAVPMEEWTKFRVSGDALRDL
ncbi:MAG: GNAT family N-acetyltransferase [Acidobacteria bacterium]|nr:GNAT family N-acetyltransferase [Acidobacteriota bacterium]